MVDFGNFNGHAKQVAVQYNFPKFGTWPDAPEKENKHGSPQCIPTMFCNEWMVYMGHFPGGVTNRNDQQVQDKINNPSFFHGVWLKCQLEPVESGLRNLFYHFNMVNAIFIVHFTALFKTKTFIEFFQVKLCPNFYGLNAEQAIAC
jgi:hypothetical protein